jgi:hypothetical protein
MPIDDAVGESRRTEPRHYDRTSIELAILEIVIGCRIVPHPERSRIPTVDHFPTRIAPALDH